MTPLYPLEPDRSTVKRLASALRRGQQVSAQDAEAARWVAHNQGLNGWSMVRVSIAVVVLVVELLWGPPGRAWGWTLMLVSGVALILWDAVSRALISVNLRRQGLRT